MLHSIRGKLLEKSPVHAVVEVNGVGYLAQIPLSTFSQLPDQGEVTLYTLLHINGNDFSLVLYGFSNPEDREIFKKLISVSGVGPNTARMVLSSLSADELRAVIINKDVAGLKRIKGIGEKTAERMIIDLHDKMGKFDGVVSSEKSGIAYNIQRQDALLALSSLGLDKSKAEKHLDKVMKESPNGSLEEWIKWVLKQI
ncbi:MAG: Holliday junction branch migration protein RuvA [Bacteroidota bacterium]|jgi:Holliday junction DNA helicase RuvA